MNLLQSMNYEEFLDRVRTMAEHRTGGEAQVTIRPILKNNNLRLDGLLILYPGENISPALYLNQYYARYLGGIPMEMILDEIFATYESCRCPDRFDLDQLRDFDSLKKHLSVRLINRSANEALLQTVPYIPFLDLAAVFSLTIDTGSLGTSTIQVRNEYLEFWDVDTEVLYRTALENLRSQDAPAFFPLSSLAVSFGGEQILSTVYVLTNQTKLYGAAFLLSKRTLTAFAERHGDFYILPSSVHEVILVPCSTGFSPASLLGMLRDVNRTDLETEDILSDNLYVYRRKEHSLGLLLVHPSDSAKKETAICTADH